VKRTTIEVPEELLEQLQAFAHEEHLSLAEVIRQGLEWRVAQRNRVPRFIGAGCATEGLDAIGRRAGEIAYTPPSWR
jgi:hypothetical protein